MPAEPEALRVFLSDSTGTPLFDDERMPRTGKLMAVSVEQLGNIVLNLGDAKGSMELNVFATKGGARVGRGRIKLNATHGTQTQATVTLMPTEAWPDTDELLGLGPNAETCSSDEQCLSGACVDGICCGQKQCGTCEACNLPGSVGTCSAVPRGETDPNPQDSCEQGRACDGQGTCRSQRGETCKVNADCALGNCVDGICCESTCEGGCRTCAAQGRKGLCVPLAAGTAATGAGCAKNGLCDGTGACGPQCRSDADCGAAEGCEKGACAKRAVDGASCSTREMCASGSCLDGHCCKASCGSCMACTGPGGTCAPRSAGEQDGAPHFSCTGKLSCNGRGICGRSNGERCDNNDQCAASHCVSGICCDGACNGACQNCGGGTCKPILNAVDPRGCNGSLMCDGSGKCGKVLGQKCGSSGECATGFCVDGACCNSACNESCFSCGSGTCTLKVNTTDAQCTGGRRCDSSGLCR